MKIMPKVIGWKCSVFLVLKDPIGRTDIIVWETSGNKEQYDKCMFMLLLAW